MTDRKYTSVDQRQDESQQRMRIVCGHQELGHTAVNNRLDRCRYRTGLRTASLPHHTQQITVLTTVAIIITGTFIARERNFG